VLNSIRGWIDQDRRTVEAQGQIDRVLHLTEAGRDALGQLRRGLLADVCTRTEELLEQHAALQGELDSASSRLAAVPAGETLEELANRQDAARLALQEAEVQLGVVRAELARVRAEILKREQARDRLLQADLEARHDQDDAVRAATHIVRVKETLGAFRNALLERHVTRIEELALDSFRQLLRKERLVSALSIDRNDFSLTVRGMNGDILSPERLSAGERQLLATAVLWGLRRASGRVVPLVIDTPLAV